VVPLPVLQQICLYLMSRYLIYEPHLITVYGNMYDQIRRGPGAFCVGMLYKDPGQKLNMQNNINPQLKCVAPMLVLQHIYSYSKQKDDLSKHRNNI